MAASAPTASPIKLVPVVYDNTDATDFKKMLPRTVLKGENAIFLFGDNFMDRTSETPGANTAAIRPSAFSDPVRSMGIPTGWSTHSGGFEELNQSVKTAITCAFERLNHVVHEQKEFTTIYYSADPKDTASFGFSLFKPCDEVKKYLKRQLQAVPDRFMEDRPPIKYTKIDATEHKLEDVAILDMIAHMPTSKKQKKAKAALVDDDDEPIVVKDE